MGGGLSIEPETLKLTGGRQRRIYLSSYPEIFVGGGGGGSRVHQASLISQSTRMERRVSVYGQMSFEAWAEARLHTNA